MSKRADGTPIVPGDIWVGVEKKKLFRQGTCKICRISLWGWKPIIREQCREMDCKPPPTEPTEPTEDT